MPFTRRLGLASLLFLVACSSKSSTDAPSASNDAGAGADTSVAPGDDAAASPDSSSLPDSAPSPIDASAIVAARPYTLHVPASWDGGTPTSPAPLVVMFHGYGASGALEEVIFRVAAAADAHGFLYAYGDGTLNSLGKRFWNATDGCCNNENIPVDDVAYFDAIVDDVSSKYPVDAKRVYVIGHSNGGFMAHRLACDRSTEVAGIMALAGDNYVDATKCNPSVPVAVLQVHGDADQTILYDGGATTTGPYPSARDSVASWAAKDGCTGALAATGQMLDVDQAIAGNETRVDAYGGCPSGVDVQLWTIQGGPHIPSLNHPQWGELVWGFLSAHSR